MFHKKFVVVGVLVVCYVNACYGAIEGSQPNAIKDDSKNDTAKGERAGRTLHKECSGSFSTKCMKLQVLSYLEDLNSRDEVSLPLPGLSIVKENTSSSRSPEELAAELARKFPGKPEEKLNGYILQRLQDFMDGHSLKYKLLDAHTTKRALDIAEEIGTGRKGGGGGGGGGFGGGKGGGAGLLAAALAGKGALAAAALGALALLAGKALMTALLSLLLSALVGLKGHGGHKSTTYEIITKPVESHSHSNSHEEHHEHEHHGHHGGYRRAYDMAYNSYMPYDSSASAAMKYE